MAAHGEGPICTADEALERLVEGNRRFLAGSVQNSGICKETLADLARGQRPYATILGCSDSRVPPEMIFDAGLGELFVVRVAGNVLSAEVAGSLQYAGAHLMTPLIVVMGHEGCGAVQAALDSKFEDVAHRARIQLLVDSLLPGLAGIHEGIPTGDRLERAVEDNVRWAVRQILSSPEGRARTAEGWMRCMGAIYEISTGRVRFLA
jgi:carbonic anhydrase